MNASLLTILDHSARGLENAIRVRILANILEISERQVRADALELIQAGHPIASSIRPPYGLFIIRTDAEKRQYAAQIKSRIRELWERLRAFDRASADALAGQLKMF